MDKYNIYENFFNAIQEYIEDGFTIDDICAVFYEHKQMLKDVESAHEDFFTAKHVDERYGKLNERD